MAARPHCVSGKPEGFLAAGTSVRRGLTSEWLVETAVLKPGTRCLRGAMRVAVQNGRLALVRASEADADGLPDHRVLVVLGLQGVHGLGLVHGHATGTGGGRAARVACAALHSAVGIMVRHGVADDVRSAPARAARRQFCGSGARACARCRSPVRADPAAG